MSDVLSSDFFGPTTVEKIKIEHIDCACYTDILSELIDSDRLKLSDELIKCNGIKLETKLDLSSDDVNRYGRDSVCSKIILYP